MELTIYTLPQQTPNSQDLVLIHGFATTPVLCWEQTRWTRTLTEAGYRLHLVALPGHTDPHLPAGWTKTASLPLETADKHSALQALANALAHYLADLLANNQHRPAHLIGFSLGARLAWELATHHPHLVTTLTAGGMPLSNHMPEFVRLLQTPAPSLETSSESSIDAPVQQQLTAVLASTPVPAPALLELAALPYQPLSTQRLPSCPVLLFAGENDPLAVTPASLTPTPGTHRIEHHTEPGRDHISVLTSRKVRNRVTDFINRHPATSAQPLTPKPLTS